MRRASWLLVMAALALSSAAGAQRARVAEGTLAGVRLTGAVPVDAYYGVRYAAPPLGALRWTAPQPPARWQGVRAATRFGARCMQQPLYPDMRFRSPAPSEDCLTLNIWTPAGDHAGATLPVLFYIHGGGAVAGDGSERRYDGASMARRGMVVVTINYRLGVFGFLATKGMAAESGDGAAGNYGLLDQAAALDWVRRNIGAFGGDPARITIGGESAGAMSVSVLMTSPMTRGVIAGAIGESGGIFAPTFHPKSLDTATADGASFAQAAGAPTLAALRALPAATLLALQGRRQMRADFIIDGRFLTETPAQSYAAGRIAKVPLLVGANSQESGWPAILGTAAPTVANYRAALTRLYGGRAEALAALYPAATDAAVPRAAMALAGDQFLGASTWNWFDQHRRTGRPTWYYHFTRVRPPALPPLTNPSPPSIGAVHSAEIEYALGNIDTNPAYAWTAEDRRISAVMQGYVTAFVRTGNPNAPGLPRWIAAPAGEAPIMRQTIDARTIAEPFIDQARYQAALPLLDRN